MVASKHRNKSQQQNPSKITKFILRDYDNHPRNESPKERTPNKKRILRNLEHVVRAKFTEMKQRGILTDIGAGFRYVGYRTGEYTPNRKA
jgi:hypothetical protein